MTTPLIENILVERQNYLEKYGRPPRRMYVTKGMLETLIEDMRFIKPEGYAMSATKEGSVGKIFGMFVYLIVLFEVATEKWDDV